MKPRPSTATILITILLFIFVASVFFTLAFTVGKKVSLFLLRKSLIRKDTRLKVKFLYSVRPKKLINMKVRKP